MKTLYRPLAGVTGFTPAQAQTIGVEGHWGRDPRAAAPVAPAVANPLYPMAGYSYDPMLNLWVPNLSSGGYVIEKFSELIANLLGASLAQTEDLTNDADAQLNSLGSVLALINTRLGGNQAAYLWQSLLSSVSGLGFRKILRTDGGDYVAPAAAGNVITFTGVNLLDRTPFVAWNLTERRLHLITAIVDPAPPAVGTITLQTPVGVANTRWIIPYLDVPHAYNSAVDATQTIAVTAPPKGVQGPTVLLSNAAQAEAGAPTTYSLPAFVSNYDLYTVWIFWDGSAGGGGNDDTYSWDIFGRIDDQAAGDWINVGTWGNTIGTALGGVGTITGLTGWRVSTRTQLRELDVRRTKTVVGVQGTCSIRVWITTAR